MLAELRRGCPDIEGGLFWRIWPFYVRWFCPVLIFAAGPEQVSARFEGVMHHTDIGQRAIEALRGN